jgi:hypothetical protein
MFKIGDHVSFDKFTTPEWINTQTGVILGEQDGHYLVRLSNATLPLMWFADFDLIKEDERK